MSIRDDLKAYLDGELPMGRTIEVRKALERDPELRREAAELRALSQSLVANAAEIVPQGAERTLAALATSRKSHSRSAYRWVLGGSVALAAVVIGWTLLPRSREYDAAGGTVVASSVATKSMQRSVMKSDQTKSVTTDSLSVMGGTGSNSLAKSILKPVAPEHAKRNRSMVALARPRRQPEGVYLQSPTNGTVGGALAPPATASDLASKPVAAPTTTGTIEFQGSLIKQASPQPQTVALSFPAKADGTQKVMAMVGRYVVPTNGLSAGIQGKALKAVETKITVDLPDEDADKIIAELKRLPLATNAAVDSSATGTRFGAVAGPSGGFGGGGTGERGFAANAGTARKARSDSETATTRGAPAAGRPGGKAAAPVAATPPSAPSQTAARATGAANAPPSVKQRPTISLSSAVPKKPKTRRVIIVISENGKPQPVP